MTKKRLDAGLEPRGDPDCSAVAETRDRVVDHPVTDEPRFGLLRRSAKRLQSSGGHQRQTGEFDVPPKVAQLRASANGGE